MGELTCMEKYDRIKSKKEDFKMAVLATPKKNSYILKKGKSEKIIKSKNSHADIAVIEERAAQFRLNNLKEKK